MEAYIGRAKFSLLFWHHRSQNIEKIPSIPVLLLGLKDGMAECIERTEGAWSSKFFVRSKVRRYPRRYIYTLEGIVLKTLINNIIPSFVMRPIH